MRVRHRAFALILVLLAVAGVFALGMRSVASSRSMQLESRILSERVRGERSARSAAVLVLKGLTTPATDRDPRSELASSDGPGTGGDTGTPIAAAPSEPKEDETPDLPAILREMLGVKAEEVKEKEAAAAAAAPNAMADGRGMTGKSRAAGGFALLQQFGLPTRPVEVTVDGMRYAVSLSDAGGLMNINSVPEDQLVRFLKLKGVDDLRARAIAAQVADWRDTDTVARELGMDGEMYTPRGISPRNADIFALEELLYLPAMSRHIFDAIKDELCVAGDGRLHLGTASRAALLSIDGMSAEAVDRFELLRATGELTVESVSDAMRGVWDRAKERVRFQPSVFIRVTVTPIGRVGAKGEIERYPEARRFEGLAVVNDEGLRELGLRAP